MTFKEFEQLLTTRVNKFQTEYLNEYPELSEEDLSEADWMDQFDCWMDRESSKDFMLNGDEQ